MLKRSIIALLFVIMLGMYQSYAIAATIYVDTPVTYISINEAIASASPGDTVVVPNGSYNNISDKNGHAISVAVSGTSGNVITIEPEILGGVTFTGTFYSEISGSYITWRHFKFLNNVSYSPLSITCCIFNVFGNYVNIERNRFLNIGYDESHAKLGSTIRYNSGANDGIALYNTFNTWHRLKSIVSFGYRTHIHHNYFTNNHNEASTDGNSAMQLGTDWNPWTDLAMIVEYNYFYKVLGDSEVISNKSSSNIYRHNVFEQSHTIVIRMGDNCTIDNNYVLSPVISGMRIYEDGHKIINNYFEGGATGYSLLYFPAGTEDPYVPPTGYEAADNCLIANNSFKVTGNWGITVGYNNATYAPNRLTFKDNYIDQASGTLYKLYYGSSITYSSNICNNYGTATYEIGGNFCTTKETLSRLDEYIPIPPISINNVGVDGVGSFIEPPINLAIKIR